MYEAELYGFLVTCYFFPGWGWYLTDLNCTVNYCSVDRRQIFVRFEIWNLILSIPNSKLIFQKFSVHPQNFFKVLNNTKLFLSEVKWIDDKKIYLTPPKNIFCCFQSNKKKNFIKNFYRDEKIFFISCKNNFTTFFWKIRKNSKNRDFRDLTKNGQIWSISTPPNFWPKSTHHTPNLTFSGVWWHNLCPGSWIFGGGCFLGGGQLIRGNALGNIYWQIHLGVQIDPKSKNGGGVRNMTNLTNCY